MTTSAVAPHLDLGRRGEDHAVAYLKEHAGLLLVARNWRCRDGEIDLVLTDGQGLLVVCEVKTRTTTHYGTPAEAITHAKATRIRHLARRWCHTHGVIEPRLRFDIVAILWPPGRAPTVDHIENAF
jgi:putative endonuclease